MGGRSKERIKADKFSFVGELTNKRLSDYGSFTSIAYQRLDSGSLTQRGIPQNPEGLNAALSAEYQRRFGRAPEWDLADNPDAESNHRKSLGFKD